MQNDRKVLENPTDRIGNKYQLSHIKREVPHIPLTKQWDIRNLEKRMVAAACRARHFLGDSERCALPQAAHFQNNEYEKNQSFISFR